MHIDTAVRRFQPSIASESQTSTSTSELATTPYRMPTMIKISHPMKIDGPCEPYNWGQPLAAHRKYHIIPVWQTAHTSSLRTYQPIVMYLLSGPRFRQRNLLDLPDPSRPPDPKYYLYHPQKAQPSTPTERSPTKGSRAHDHALLPTTRHPGTAAVKVTCCGCAECYI